MKPGIIFTALVSTVFCVSAGSYAADPPPQVRIVTPLGAITLEPVSYTHLTLPTILLV